MKKCNNCNVDFDPKRVTQTFCSKICKVKMETKLRKRSGNTCSWPGCNSSCDLNKKTNKPYYYCDSHRNRRNNKGRNNYKINGGQQNKRNKEYNKRLRDKFLNLYGAKCSCCGEGFEPFLTLDHVQGDGKRERTTANGKPANPYNAYRNAIKKIDNDRYQILCMNCNFAKGTLGECACPKKNSFEYEDNYREG